MLYTEPYRPGEILVYDFPTKFVDTHTIHLLGLVFSKQKAPDKMDVLTISLQSKLKLNVVRHVRIPQNNESCVIELVVSRSAPLGYNQTIADWLSIDLSTEIIDFFFHEPQSALYSSITTFLSDDDVPRHFCTLFKDTECALNIQIIKSIQRVTMSISKFLCIPHRSRIINLEKWPIRALFGRFPDLKYVWGQIGIGNKPELISMCQKQETALLAKHYHSAKWRKQIQTPQVNLSAQAPMVNLNARTRIFAKTAIQLSRYINPSDRQVEPDDRPAELRSRTFEFSDRLGINNDSWDEEEYST